MTSIDLENKRKVHFIGIGGVGMSGVASILLELGHAVSGSDLKDNSLLEKLRMKGAKIFIGHKDSNLDEGIDLVVYTSCIKKDNPEMVKARFMNIPLVHRQSILAALMKKKKGIAITGAHGKSTTTALVGTILLKAGLDPTVIVGAEVVDFGSNAVFGRGNLLAVEADESDGSLIALEPHYAIITNIDREHLDYYENIDNIINTKRTFIERIKEEGCLFCLQGDGNITRLLDGYKKSYKTFGLSPDADIYARDLSVEGFTTTFKCIYNNKEIDKFRLALPGRHNVLNALAAILLALEIGIKPSVIKKALSSYRGTLRRFEVKGRCRGILVIEDYAHHPTEIEAILQVCKNWNRGRIISIFQPHRFSRTKLLADEFAKAFKLTDELILTDIYSAYENPIKDVSSKLIFDKMDKSGKEHVHLLPRERIVKYIRPRVKRDDIILVLGAGDIGDVSNKIVKSLESQA